MAKMTQILLRKFKLTDFLLGFGFRTRRLFCRYWCVTCVYRFSQMYVKRNGEQYAFKKANIEEYVKVIYLCQTCCQLVALCL